MADQKLGSIVARERARLAKKRDALVAQRASIDSELAAIERELTAAQAYESALGKQSPAARAPTKKKAGKGKKVAARAKSQAKSQAKAGRRPRRGSRREAIVDVIGKSKGASRGDILAALGVKGDKAAEQAVSNALTAMKKSGRIAARAGKYFPS